MSRLFQRQPLERSYDLSCDRIMGRTNYHCFAYSYALYKIDEELANLTSLVMI